MQHTSDARLYEQMYQKLYLIRPTEERIAEVQSRIKNYRVPHNS